MMRNLMAITILVAMPAPAVAQDMDRTATAVFSAAAEGNVRQLREYLDAGYEVNYQRQGDTALSMAVVFKRPEAVRLLLERGANPAVLTYEEFVVGQQTPRPLIDYARNSSSPEIVRLLEARLNEPLPTAGVTPVRAPTPNRVRAPIAGSNSPNGPNLLSQFKEAVQKDPELLSAAQQTQSGASVAAIPTLNARTRTDPQNAEAWYLLGMAYAQTGQQELSNFATARAASIKPELNDLTRHLAEIGAMKSSSPAPQSKPSESNQQLSQLPQSAGATTTTGQQTWPEAGSIPPGERILMSTSGGERWRPGVVTEIGSGEFVGTIKVMESPEDSWSGSWLDPSRVVRPTREPFWTAFFVGDWEVNTGGAVNYRTDGRDVYQVVTGGGKLPPLQINSDGTYQWREADSQAKIVTGRWKARDDVPGIVIMSGPRGVDWTLWNTSTVSTRNVYKRDQIRVHGPVYSWEALRLTR